MVIDVVDEIETGRNVEVVIVFVVFEQVDESGHYGVRDRSRATNARLFWGGVSNSLAGLFHVAF